MSTAEKLWADEQLKALREAYMRLLDAAEAYRDTVAANASQVPAAQAQVLLSGQVKVAEQLLRVLETEGMDHLLQLVDRANGPWNRMHVEGHGGETLDS